MPESQMNKLSGALAERTLEKKARLDAYGPPAPDVLRYLQSQLRVVLTYHSNAIEGNTLDLKQTRLVLEEGLPVGGHTMREYVETLNHAAAFDYLEQLVSAERPLDADAVLNLHALVMKDLLEKPGQLRDVVVHIRGALWTPPPARQVGALLDQWLEWLAGEGQRYEVIARAAIAHSQFEAIHPFIDGNGRLGRLLLGMMLMREGYPPAIVLCQWRNEYLAALDVAQVGGRYRSIINLVVRAVELGLDLYLDAAESASEPLLPLAELAQEFGYSVNYLAERARAGRLAASKRNGQWYARRSDIAQYREQVAKERRGRPPVDVGRLPSTGIMTLPIA